MPIVGRVSLQPIVVVYPTIILLRWRVSRHKIINPVFRMHLTARNRITVLFSPRTFTVKLAACNMMLIAGLACVGLSGLAQAELVEVPTDLSSHTRITFDPVSSSGTIAPRPMTAENVLGYREAKAEYDPSTGDVLVTVGEGPDPEGTVKSGLGVLGFVSGPTPGPETGGNLLRNDFTVTGEPTSILYTFPDQNDPDGVAFLSTSNSLPSGMHRFVGLLPANMTLSDEVSVDGYLGPNGDHTANLVTLSDGSDGGVLQFVFVGSGVGGNEPVNMRVPLTILASAVPEPSTISLLGIAATGLVARRRR